MPILFAFFSVCVCVFRLAKRETASSAAIKSYANSRKDNLDKTFYTVRQITYKHQNLMDRLNQYLLHCAPKLFPVWRIEHAHNTQAKTDE